MKTINERLSEVLLFLCKKDGYSPETLKRQNGGLLIPNDLEEIKKLRETVSYLKDYAKLQILSKSIGNSEFFEKDIEEARENLLKQIEEKEIDYTKIPKKKSLKVNDSQLYGYEAKIAEEKKNAIIEYNEQINAKRLQIKEDIKVLKDRIKRLDTLKRSVGNPKKVMTLLFDEEKQHSLEEYQRLVNVCAQSLTSGLSGKNLVGEDKLFMYDEATNSYSMNSKNVRRYISVAKKGRAIVSCKDYIDTKRKAEDIKKDAEREEKLLLSKQELLDKVDTEEFQKIHGFINGIISEYRNIRVQESNKRKFSLISKIKRVLGKEVHTEPTRKTAVAREKLEERIRSFLSDVKSDESLNNMYEKYVNTRRLINGQGALSMEGIEIMARNLIGGITRFDLPLDEMSDKDFAMYLKRSTTVSQQRIDRLNDESKVEQERANSIHEGLSKTALNLLEKNDEETILDIHKRFYTEGDSRSRAFARKTISDSAAIMILESLVSKKKIPFGELCGQFGEVIGKESVNEEVTNVTSTVKSKIEELKSKIVELTRLEPKEIEESI